MIVIVNLERLSGDGYKMNANSPLVTPPSYITHAQLRYTPFTSSQVIQGTFVTGAYSTVEFDVTGANLTRYLKLYTSTDGTTYNEVKSWGGTDGIRQITDEDLFVLKSAESQSITATGGNFEITATIGQMTLTSEDDMSLTTDGIFSLIANGNGGLNLNALGGYMTFVDSDGSLSLVRGFGTPSSSDITPATMKTRTVILMDGTTATFYCPD